MSTGTLRNFVGMMFLVSIICCLIGSGALAHLFISTQTEKRQDCNSLFNQIRQREAALAYLRESALQVEGDLRRLLLELRQLQALLKQAEGSLETPKEKEPLKEELERLQRMISEAAAKIQRLKEICRDTKEIELSRKNLTMMLENVEAERNHLLAQRDQARKNAAFRSNVFSVTALGGGCSGRTRAAVFAECSEQGLIVQPKGKHLNSIPTVEDKQTFLSFVQKTHYVVFLIRPDGFSTFSRYRRLANTGMNDPVDIGFEPVNTDWRLVYPTQKD